MTLAGSRRVLNQHHGVCRALILIAAARPSFAAANDLLLAPPDGLEGASDPTDHLWWYAAGSMETGPGPSWDESWIGPSGIESRHVARFA
jgi:hypothetical protein